MRLLLFICLFTLSNLTAGSHTTRTLVFPSQTSTSYVEIKPLKPLDMKAFTLCMRVATELTGWREVILFAYRTQDIDEMNMWRESDGSLSFYLAGNGVIFNVPQLGALETHLCFTWSSSTGAAAVFVDGRKSLTKIYKKGHSIRPGGRIILGQDPDQLLGGFYADQSFVGEITDVNLWDFVLPEHKVREQFNGIRQQGGNVIDWYWADLEENGEVEIINVLLELESPSVEKMLS